MVPDILLATIEPPEGLPLTGRGCFLQAFECRPKKDNRGELNAKEISDGLPFLEFEVHKQLLNKLHINGMNAVFGLKVSLFVTNLVSYLNCLLILVSKSLDNS